MTTTERTVHPRAVTVGLEIEHQIHDIGSQASAAVDEIFRKVSENGWHFQSNCGGDPEEIHTYVGERLEYQASAVIREQASNAILALWVHLRRGCQGEFGSEESLGALFNDLATLVAELLFRAMPDPFVGDVVGPTVDAEQVTA